MCSQPIYSGLRTAEQLRIDDFCTVKVCLLSNASQCILFIGILVCSPQAGDFIVTNNYQYAVVLGLFVESIRSDSRKLLLVLYFKVPDEDENYAGSDLAASGATILQFRLAYVSCQFAFIDSTVVKAHSNIFRIPAPLPAVRTAAAGRVRGGRGHGGRKPVAAPTTAAASVDNRSSPTPFIIDVELDGWSEREKLQK